MNYLARFSSLVVIAYASSNFDEVVGFVFFVFLHFDLPSSQDTIDEAFDVSSPTFRVYVREVTLGLLEATFADGSSLC